jgi:5-carboxymethyl-2-hydroxymuconate isomerase
MPHLVIHYTAQIEAETDMGALCRELSRAIVGLRDEAGQPVFPPGGTRVLAYPAAHHAVTDASGDHAFVYLNARITRGRSLAIQQQLGDALLAVVKAHFELLFTRRPIGITLQVEEGQESFDAKHNNLHPLFQNK